MHMSKIKSFLLTTITLQTLIFSSLFGAINSFTFSPPRSRADLEQAEQVFVAAFKLAYEPLTREELPVRDRLDEFLHSAFADEYDRFEKHDQNEIIIVARGHDEEIVGYISFSPTEEEGTYYINQLAVAPTKGRRGLGKALVFHILEYRPTLKKLVLVTRRANRVAKDFYSKIGFTESSYTHEGLDPVRYVGYEFNIGSKS